MNYQQAASAFTKVGLQENSLVNEGQILKALDNLARKNGITEYNRNVADQLWSETTKQPGDKVYVGDFIATILKGEALVRGSLNQLEGEIQRISNEYDRNQKMQDIVSYTEDLKFLTVPFGAAGPQRSRVLPPDSIYSNPVNPAGNQSRMSNSTVIFSKEVPSKQSGSSTDLKVTFLLTIILLCVQIIVMYHKHHFLSLLAYLSVFGIFFLGYFDGQYMKFTKGLLFLSIIFDVVWLVFNFNEYWNPYPETQHSTLQYAYLKFIIFFIVILMFFKLVLIAILFKYRNNSSSMKKLVDLCGAKFNLNGSPVSPVAKILSGNAHPADPLYSQNIAYNPIY